MTLLWISAAHAKLLDCCSLHGVLVDERHGRTVSYRVDFRRARFGIGPVAAMFRSML